MNEHCPIRSHLRWCLAGCCLLYATLALAAGNDFDSRLKVIRAQCTAGEFPAALAALPALAAEYPERYEAPALAASVLYRLDRPFEARSALLIACDLAKDEDWPVIDRIEREGEVESLWLVTAAQSGKGDPAKAKTRQAVLTTQFTAAQALADKTARQQACVRFLADSTAYAVDYPNDTLIWYRRARAALETDRETDGILAAQALRRLGLLNSQDDTLQELAKKMQEKKWFTKKTTEQEEAMSTLSEQLTWLAKVRESNRVIRLLWLERVEAIADTLVMSLERKARLTPEEVQEWRTLEQLTRDAALRERAAGIKETLAAVLHRSDTLAARLPESGPLWIWRARIALELDDATAGPAILRQLRLLTGQFGHSSAVEPLIERMVEKQW